MESDLNLDEIKKIAKAELQEEMGREAIDRYKKKLRRKRSLWDLICPYKIIVVKKHEEENNV